MNDGVCDWGAITAYDASVERGVFGRGRQR